MHVAIFTTNTFLSLKGTKFTPLLFSFVLLLIQKYGLWYIEMGKYQEQFYPPENFRFALSKCE